MACVVFEDLQLADFGNRIPSLTFEVVADPGVVAVDAIATELSGGAIGQDESAARTIGGYAASGRSVADALAPLVQGYDLALREDEDGLGLVGTGTGVSVTVPHDWQARIVNGRKAETAKRSRDRSDQVPVRLSVRHYDSARDYQAGVQTAVRAGPGQGEQGIDLPATIDAGSLRALAEERLQGLWTGRSRIELRCDWRALEIVPGDRVRIAGQSGDWRVERSEWEAMAVTLRLRQIAAGPVDVLPAGSGAAVAQSDVAHGATQIAVVELPAMGDDLIAEPVVAVAASGASAGWRRAALFTEDALGGLTALRPTALPATMGRLVSGMSAASALLVDTVSAPVVELVSDAMLLTGADDAALAAGANLAMIGDELVQFGHVVQVGARQFRLERLWRGRRGTEPAIAAHGVDTPFVLIEAERLALLPATQLHPGDPVRVRAIGIGDAVPVHGDRTVTGIAMLPVAPVHGTVEPDGAGGRLFAWVRRSRNGWRWRDGVDVPLGEEREAYALVLSRAGTVFRRVEVAAPGWSYDAAAMAADRAAGHGGAAVADIRQIGTHGLSPALSIAFTL
ncbi:phage tail protein [Sphingobium subterraneum]|nr:phage tail protein [Sphingobium subterraneum]